jgi:Tol biopolymer transport system component
MRAPVLLFPVAALLVALAAFPAAADATWPGKPGKIAYHQSGDGPIFSARPDGSHDHRLLRQSEGDPAWSPRGRWIAYPISTEVWRARADGSHRRRIARLESAVSDPAWGPHGRRLVFTLNTTDRQYNDVGYLYVVRRNGKGLHRLAKGHDATWTANGLLAYATNRGAIATIRPDGSGRHIWIPGKRDFDVTNLDFSPNGRRIVYQRYGLDGGRSSIRTLNFRTGRRTRFPALTKQVFATDVAWTPSGRRLAYLQDRRNGESLERPNEIRTISPRGKGRRTLIKFRSTAFFVDFAWQTRH